MHLFRDTPEFGQIWLLLLLDYQWEDNYLKIYGESLLHYMCLFVNSFFDCTKKHINIKIDEKVYLVYYI